MSLCKLIFALFLVAGVAFEVQAGQYLPSTQSQDSVCDEIGMSSQAPSNCLLSLINYKGRTCYQCRGRSSCNPSCTRGKICSDKRCICPPNKGLVDCNGVCVNGAQCRGLAKTKR